MGPILLHPLHGASVQVPIVHERGEPLLHQSPGASMHVDI